MWWLLCTLFSAALHVCSGEELPPGHLKPLGAHREPEHVARQVCRAGIARSFLTLWPLSPSRLTHSPSPHEFYTSYVQPGRPVILEGLLNSTATLFNWGQDSYLRERFGEVEVHVENEKKENRSGHAFVTTMADYLDVS